MTRGERIVIAAMLVLIVVSSVLLVITLRAL